MWAFISKKCGYVVWRLKDNDQIRENECRATGEYLTTQLTIKLELHPPLELYIVAKPRESSLQVFTFFHRMLELITDVTITG
jgi:hypothetical protein